GTSLALVGAYILAGELTSQPGLAVALRRYEQLARRYVTTGQKLPPGGIRSYAPKSRAAIWLRIASTQLMVSKPFRSLAKKMLFSKADAITLPDYDTPTSEPAADATPR
ncbi:MAG: FAD-binding monooxygenase, partial [Nocardioidaceae bacterium]